MSGALDLDALVALADAAAAAGADVVRRGFGTAPELRSKGPGDWVSDVDMSSERAVRAVLTAGAPDLPVFGEEEGGERASVGWLVDPLDGTTNFLHGFPMVGVSVGLIVDGRPVVGVIHAPMHGDVFTARHGGGAFRNGVAMRVSERPVEHAVCATGFPFRARADRITEYLPVFVRALDAFEDLRRAGAASLDLALTAAGVYDGYFEQSLGPWDVCAGAVLVREAGGVVTDWSGDDEAFLDSGDVLVGPPPVHTRLLEIAHPS